MEAQLKLVLSHYLLFLFISSVLTQQAPLSSGAERSALLELRSSLGIRAREWPRKVDPCSEWAGVKCINGRVVGINLSGRRRSRIGRLNPRFAVDSLANFTLLISFNSSGFSLPGSIPDWFSQRLSALQALDLRSSSIVGIIPSSLGTMSALNSLYLSDNALTGVIPPTLGRLSSLSVLDLSHNLLTGSIPSSFSAFGNLTKLDLSSNFLSGPIPSGFGSLYTLRFLNLYNNSLSGSVPIQLGNLSQLIELDLGFNSLSGTLSEELGGMRNLQKMSLGNNELEGPFPGSLLLNLTQLQNVVLSWNHFNGEVSESFESMARLRLLDISGNNVTGVLPDLVSLFNVTGTVFNFSNNLFYGNLSHPVGNFGLVDLSGNYFQGSAPNGSSITINGNCFMRVPNQRSVEDCRMFYANRGLSFDDNGTLNPMQPSKSKKRLTYVMVGLFGGIGFIVLLVLALVLLLRICDKGNEIQGGNSNVVPVREGANTPPPKVSADLSGLVESFTYKQMLQATSDFSDTNLIKNGHSGDLFWGTLENGSSVVIKKVDLLSIGTESYMLELDLVSKVSHTRLVPLLGHCLEHENEKFLVYKYMPYGDLSNSLYRFTNLEDGSPQSLDWITRLKIAIGAAEGLAYLHHECNPPLVHGDIQASSILLDDKYEVRLGSLSEIRAQGEDNHQNMITRFLRIPQTSEQGTSGSPSTSCAYDVYCFGKVLLELVTGKLGLSKEWLDKNLPFINIYEKELMIKIVDQSLIVDEDLLEEVWAVAVVAKSCLNPKHSKRPLMRHVLRALENPFRVVREDNFSSWRLRTTSSRRSWSAAFFGSWSNSSFESVHFLREANREEQGAIKQFGRFGSQGSGSNTNGHSSSHKRSSSEIFPEPVEMQDLETVDEERR